MYNRYIPQPDGTYRRNHIPDPNTSSRPVQQREETPRQESLPDFSSPIPEIPPCQNGQPCAHMRPQNRPSPAPQWQNRPSQPLGIGNFFKQLLPKDFDTEDLLIVLLLLLMAGDQQEDQNTALLTLALYLFM